MFYAEPLFIYYMFLFVHSNDLLVYLFIFYLFVYLFILFIYLYFYSTVFPLQIIMAKPAGGPKPKSNPDWDED